MRTLRIMIGPVEIYAEMHDAAAADAFWRAAPFETEAWVGEGFIYFRAPFSLPPEPELAVAEAPVGALGFWPAKGLVGIGFKSPPDSRSGGLVHFKGSATLWARSRSDVSALVHVVDGDTVKVEPMD